MDSARRFFLLCSTLFAFAVFAAPAYADELPANCGNLQDQLNDSNPGDTVVLADDELCTDHYDLPSHQITLRGAGNRGDNGFDGDTGEGRLQILHGENVDQTTIANLMFRNGEANGSGHDNLNDGGAIHITGTSTPVIEGNIFVSNEANGAGGAVFIDAGIDFGGFPEGSQRSANSELPDVVLSENDFGVGGDGNAAGVNSRGGGAYVGTFLLDLVASDNRFSQNEAPDGSGGGLYSMVIGDTTLDGNSFTGNSAYAKGGGATLRVCGSGEVSDNTFEDNVLEAPEGPVFLGDVSASVFGPAGGPMGAGLHMAPNPQCSQEEAGAPDEDFEVIQRRNDFVENVIRDEFEGRRGSGAGEGTQDLDVKSTDDSFLRNVIGTPDGEGAGYGSQNQERTVFEARNLVAMGNDALVEEEFPEREGAAEVVATGEGGGIYVGANGSAGELRLYNSTVVSNEAGDGSGLAGDECDALTLHNSIVWGNTGADDEIAGFFDCGTFRESAQIEPGEGRDVRFTDTCVDGVKHEGEGNICADPQLSTDAGGKVDQTANSPTLNTGSNALVSEDSPDLPNDYRGQARVQGSAVDMGADETTVTPATQTTAAALGCLNAGGNVNGRNLGPARLGRTRPVQRSLFAGNRLRTRLGLDKYCAVPSGWFRIGYPNARLNRPFGRSLRRSVSNRVVLILSSSPRFSVSGIRRNSTAATARRRLRGERAHRIGKNTWYVVRASGRRLLLVKVQSGRVKEVGLGDARVAPTDRLLRAYLRAWEGGL